MKKTIWLAFAATFIISCSNSQPKTDAVATKEPAAAPTIQEAATVADSTEISLNNGQKWQINVEMKPFISDAERLLESYISDSSKDFKRLSAQLSQKDAALIKSCSMTGRSHEELHLWLHPHLELVAALGKAKSPEQAERLVQRLEQSFAVFHQYFD